MSNYDLILFLPTLDDVSLHCKTWREECLSDVNNFQNLCQRLGVPLKDSIYVFEVESIKMEVWLPEDKLFLVEAVDYTDSPQRENTAERVTVSIQFFDRST